MPDDEEEDKEAMQENKLTDNLVEGIQLSKTDFDFFKDVGPSRVWALKLQQTAKEGLVLGKNI